MMLSARMATVVLTPLLLLTLLVGPPSVCGSVNDETAPSEKIAELKVDLPNIRHIVEVHRDAKGEHRFLITYNDGTLRRLTPVEFAEILEVKGEQRAWWHRIFNVSSPIGFVWVTIGLIGQLLFTGRMLVQWLASERKRRSIVPPVFWWLSLIGATMLMVYFIWRKDIVGILGQGTGWLIYVRNLYFIYTHTELPDFTADPAPEPELDQS